MSSNHSLYRRGILITIGSVSVASQIPINSRATRGNFSVSIEEYPEEVVAGDSITFIVLLTNNGDRSDSTDVQFENDPIGGESVTLEPGQSKLVELTTATNVRDGGDSELFTVVVDGDDDGQRVRLLDPANFQVNITGIPDRIPTGQTRNLIVTITNEGEADASKTVTMRAEPAGPFHSGQEEREQSVSLGGGDSQELTYELDSEWFGEGEMIVNIITEDNVDSAKIQLVPAKPATYSVGISSVEASAEGDPVITQVVLKNIGDEPGESTIRVKLDGGSATDFIIDIAPGKQTTESVEIPTVYGDSGTRTLTVESEYESVSDQFELQESPFFEVSIEDMNTPIPNGFPLQLQIKIENVSSITGKQEIVVSTDDTQISTQNMELEGGQPETLPIEIDTSSYDVSDGITISSRFDSVEITPEVEDVAFFEIQDVTVGDASAGGRLPVDVSVKNRGAVDGTQTVVAEIDGVASTEQEISLETDGGNDLQLEVPTSEDDAGENILLVSTDNDRVTSDFTLGEADDTGGSNNSDDGEDSNSNGDSTENDADDQNASGFGMGSAVAAVTTLTYVLKNRVTSSSA